MQQPKRKEIFKGTVEASVIVEALKLYERRLKVSKKKDKENKQQIIKDILSLFN